MLTKQDLSSVRKLIREEVETEGENTRERLESEIRMSRIRVQTDIRDLSQRIKNLEIKTLSLEKSSKKIISAIAKLRKDLDGTINMADKGLVRLEKRVNVIEDQLGIPTPSII